jgi:hypothetical protein
MCGFPALALAERALPRESPRLERRSGALIEATLAG